MQQRRASGARAGNGVGRALLSLGAVLTVVVGLTGCSTAPPHSSAHAVCRRSCVREHDACVLGANQGWQLQQCDNQLSPCLAGCPY